MASTIRAKGTLATLPVRLRIEILAVDGRDLAAKLLLPVEWRVERQLRLMPLPVGIVGEAGQRTIDPRARHFEAVGAVDRITPRLFQRVEHVGDAARQIGAVVDRQLPRIGALGHHLQRALVALAEQRHAHEIEAERSRFGFDQSNQRGVVSHRGSKHGSLPPRSEPRDPLHLTM